MSKKKKKEGRRGRPINPNSLRQRAARLGVSKSTLWRREQKKKTETETEDENG